MPRRETSGAFMRFTIRDVVLVTAIVALVAVLVLERQSRRNERIVTVNWTSDEEREWAKERLKAAKSEFEQITSITRGGWSPSVDEFCSTTERYARAAEESPADAEMRLKELEAALAFAKQLESVTYQKYKMDVEPLFIVNRAQYARADVEARLKRVQREVVLERSKE
jgi:hypothetical protein